MGTEDPHLLAITREDKARRSVENAMTRITTGTDYTEALMDLYTVGFLRGQMHERRRKDGRDAEKPTTNAG